MSIAEIYDFYWNKCADSRTKNLPLVASPIIIPAILFAYLYLIKKCGPEFMKNRKPYNLLTFVKCYNMFQIAANLYIVKTYISAGWFSEIPFTCVVVEYGSSPSDIEIIWGTWLAFNLKLVDLIETVVFVLRKKDRQISFLHVYHHITTVIFAWITVKYICGVMASFPLLINSCVHVIMYSYYLSSTFGEKMQKALTPVKPFITIIQMLQFILMMLYSAQTFFPSCSKMKVPGSVFFMNIIINFALFYNFYQNNYSKWNQKKS